MAQENTRQSFVARVANALSRKPVAAAVAEPVYTPSAVQLAQLAPKIPADEMYRRITGNGASLPG